MKILCRTKDFKPTIPATQQVNMLGKYLNKHIDGAFKITFSSNICDVYFKLLYEVPFEEKRPDNLYEMIIDINITTYQNKLRINVIEVTPEERTLGSDLYKPELLKNLNEAFVMIYDNICKRISRAYEDYDFVF